MSRALVAVAVAAVFAGVMSCNGEDTEDHTTPAGINVLTRIGSTWTYEVEIQSARFGDPVVDTVEARVQVIDAVGLTLIPRPDVLWRISWENGSDTSSVYIFGDTLDIEPWSNQGLRPLAESYVYPLLVGNKWPGPNCCNDTTRVVARDTTSVPAGTYDTFRLESSAFGPNYHIRTTAWVDPAVGIIKLYNFVFDFGLIEEKTWVMTGYFPAEAEGAAPFRRPASVSAP